MLEATIEHLLNHRVRATLGGLCIKLAPTIKGMPDRLVVLPGGRFYLVELKAPGGRVSLSQAHMHAVLAELGVPVAVLRSGDEVRAWIAARADDAYYTDPDRPRRRPKKEELEELV